MHDHSHEWDTRYRIEFSDRTAQTLTLRKAAKHCEANGLTAIVFRDGVEVGWVDRCGNYGVSA
jgi:hypothetical protein